MIFSQWMYLRGLLVLESTGDSMLMYHGTTQNGANSIMRTGLRKQSEMDPTTNMAGEFWATTNHEYASLMSMVGETEPTIDNPPAVLKFSLPASVFNVLTPSRKFYNQLGEGAFEFYAKAFPVLNKAIAENGGFQVAPLAPKAEQQWKVKLAQMDGVSQQPLTPATR